MAKKSAVSRRDLEGVSGFAEVVRKLENIIDEVSAKELKQVYVAAAAHISDQARDNIASLNASAELKEVLTAAVVTNAGPDDQNNAISAMVQPAAVRRLGKGRSVPNPAWFEFGTEARKTADGWNRGQIQPTPVFRPAIAQAKGKVKDELVKGISEIVRKATK
jgi:hypothetical protein